MISKPYYLDVFYIKVECYKKAEDCWSIEEECNVKSVKTTKNTTVSGESCIHWTSRDNELEENGCTENYCCIITGLGPACFKGLNFDDIQSCYKICGTSEYKGVNSSETSKCKVDSTAVGPLCFSNLHFGTLAFLVICLAVWLSAFGALVKHKIGLKKTLMQKIECILNWFHVFGLLKNYKLTFTTVLYGILLNISIVTVIGQSMKEINKFIRADVRVDYQILATNAGNLPDLLACLHTRISDVKSQSFNVNEIDKQIIQLTYFWSRFAAFYSVRDTSDFADAYKTRSIGLPINHGMNFRFKDPLSGYLDKGYFLASFGYQTDVVLHRPVSFKKISREDPFSCNGDPQYDSMKCELDCIQTLSIQKCNCHPIDSAITSSLEQTGNGTTPYCLSMQSVECYVYTLFNSMQNEDFLKDIYLNCSKACPTPCNYRTFNRQISFSRLRSQSTSAEPRESASHHNTLILTMRYENLEVITMEDVYVMNPTDLLSNIGGIIGVWLGFSLLSCVKTMEKITSDFCEMSFKKSLKDETSNRK